MHLTKNCAQFPASDPNSAAEVLCLVSSALRMSEWVLRRVLRRFRFKSEFPALAGEALIFNNSPWW